MDIAAQCHSRLRLVHVSRSVQRTTRMRRLRMPRRWALVAMDMITHSCKKFTLMRVRRKPQVRCIPCIPIIDRPFRPHATTTTIRTPFTTRQTHRMQTHTPVMIRDLHRRHSRGWHRVQRGQRLLQPWVQCRDSRPVVHQTQQRQCPAHS